MNAPRDEMKLSVEFPGDIGDCSELLMSTFTTVWFASCSSRRKRETRTVVALYQQVRFCQLTIRWEWKAGRVRLREVAEVAQRLERAYNLSNR